MEIIAKDNKNAVLVKTLSESETLEELYLGFQTYGRVKDILYNKQKATAIIVFENSTDADKIIQIGICSPLVKLKNVFFQATKRDYFQMNDYKLFLIYVHEKIEYKDLKDFLSQKFGRIIQFSLKKDKKGKNKSYGMVQFKEKESYEKVLEYQMETKDPYQFIYFPNTNLGFAFEIYDPKQHESQVSKVKIMNCLNKTISKLEIEAETAKFLQQIEKKLDRWSFPDLQFSFLSNGNQEKSNFTYLINFRSPSEEAEQEIFTLIQQQIRLNFGKDPKIICKSVYSNERKLQIKGLKENISIQQFQDWIFKHLGIDAEGIEQMKLKKQIKTSNGIDKVNNILIISFDKIVQGQQLIDFCNHPLNSSFVDEVFEGIHSIKIFNRIALIKNIKNVFNQFVDLAFSEKATQFKFYVEYLTSKREDLNLLTEGQANIILSNFVYQRILKLDSLFQEEPSREVKAFLSLCKKNSNTLAPILSNLDVLEVDDTIEIITDQDQLITRCYEGLELIYDNIKQLIHPRITIFTRFQNIPVEEKFNSVDIYIVYLKSFRIDFEEVTDQKKLLGELAFYLIFKFEQIQNIESKTIFDKYEKGDVKALLLLCGQKATEISNNLIESKEIDDIINIMLDNEAFLSYCIKYIEELLEKEQE